MVVNFTSRAGAFLRSDIERIAIQYCVATSIDSCSIEVDNNAPGFESRVTLRPGEGGFYLPQLPTLNQLWSPKGKWWPHANQIHKELWILKNGNLRYATTEQYQGGYTHSGVSGRDDGVHIDRIEEGYIKLVGAEYENPDGSTITVKGGAYQNFFEMKSSFQKNEKEITIKK